MRRRDRERQRHGTSLVQTVIDLLRQALGVGGVRSNGLGSMAGRGSEDEFEALQTATRPLSEIDPELWR